MPFSLDRGGVFPPIVQFRTTGRFRHSVCFRYSETRGRYRRCDRSAFCGLLTGSKRLNSLCVLHILIHSNRPLLPVLSDGLRYSQLTHNPDVPDSSIHTKHTEHTVHQHFQNNRIVCVFRPPATVRLMLYIRYIGNTQNTRNTQNIREFRDSKQSACFGYSGPFSLQG